MIDLVDGSQGELDEEFDGIADLLSDALLNILAWKVPRTDEDDQLYSALERYAV